MNKEKWLDWAETTDALRLYPRFVIMVYGHMLWKTAIWFMKLPAPTTQQAAFTGTVFGIAGTVFALYMTGGYDWVKRRECNARVS